MTPSEREIARVEVVDALGLQLGETRPELDALARLAAAICGTPSAAINLIDAESQWQAAAFGGEPARVARRDAMCEQVVRSREMVYVSDARAHTDYRDSPYVTGRLGQVRLYVSAPLVVSDQVVGTLCAHAPQVMVLTGDQMARLEDLALLAASQLEMRRRANDLTQAVIRDPLTGLYNRGVLTEILERVYSRRHRSLTTPGVIFVDLNGFKPVNDTYGHAAGDVVLKQVAARLVDTVRASDVVFRLGGDEFVIVAEEPPALSSARDGVRRVGQRIRSAMSQPFVLDDGRELALSAAVGWAVDGGGEETPAQLLHRADQAMYLDKRHLTHA